MAMTEEEIKYHKERIRKRRQKLLKRRARKVAILRFIAKYIVPVILIVVGILSSIFLPREYYFDGTYYDIKKAIISTLVVFIPVTGIIIFILYKWNKFLRDYEIIK